MPSVGRIGEAVQTLATVTEVIEMEVTVDWTVGDFFSLSTRLDDYYESPSFDFAGSRWCLRLFPNGRMDYPEDDFPDKADRGSSEGCVSLFLRREDAGPSKSVTYAFGCKTTLGTEELVELENAFSSTLCCEWGDDLWTRDELRSDESILGPDGALTLVCRLQCSERAPARFSAIKELCQSMKRMLSEGHRSDFTLKLGGREWPVHKVVLESRCPYFASLFRHEWVENTVGEVTFEDVSEEALHNVLVFLYSGDVEGVCPGNVCDVYAAARKFLLEDLGALCVEYIRQEMCAELVCGALVLADAYGEEGVHRSALEFFVREEDLVFESPEWKELKKRHGSVAADLLEEVAKRRKEEARVRQMIG